MKLSPNVSPFVPRQQANVSYSSLWKLSPDVSEFVPSWLNSSNASQDHTQASSDATATKRSKHTTSPSVLGTDDQRVETIATPPKPSSLKNRSIKKSGKKYMLEHEPDSQVMKEKAQSWEDNAEGIESDFPALTAPAVENSPGWSQTAWNKQATWGVSFSDKVKSSNLSNASSYFHNEPSISLTNDETKERQKTSLKSKDITRHEVKLDKKERKKTIDGNFVKKSADEITKLYYDDEGFSIVRNKSKKTHKTVESVKEDKSSFEKEKHDFAWSENHWDEQANQKSLTVKKFSENQSNSSENGPSRNLHGTEIQKNRSSSSEGWSSGRNIAEKKRETMQGPRKGNATKQSSKQNKDYYTFKSTHGVSDSRSKKENDRKEQCSEDKGKKTRGSNVLDNLSTVEVKPFLSYSDILKSKPNIQLPEPEKLEGTERGILRLPGETSEEGEDDQQEVEEQEGRSKKKKKKKKKKKSGVEAQSQPVKKSKETLTLDFGDMFAKIMESSLAKKKSVIRTGGLLPAQASLPPKETRNTRKYEHQASNVLDSTAPIVFHGKEREFPKKRKPSAMRKILMKEREEKKMLREGKSPNEQSSQDEKSDKEMSDDQQLDSDDIGTAEVKKSIHSRKFREYCDQDLDYDINGLVIKLLKELIRFQDRLYHKDPVKAKARRRFVCGLREVHKHAKLKKLKCVIVTPNLEPTKSKGGLDDLLASIIDICHSQNVPVIFSLNRQVLGKVLLKKVPVSIVGIFYYDGAQDYFKNLMTLTEVARETYKDKFNRAKEKFMLEKQMVKDNALIEEGLHSTVVQKDESQGVTTNDVEDNESFTGENDISEDSFGDEKTKESLGINEEECTIESLALDEAAELMD